MMLSPSYDLMNTKIHLSDNLLALNLFKELEQTSLPLGEKYNYKSADFIEFGKRLKIKETIITKIIDLFNKKKVRYLIWLTSHFYLTKPRNCIKIM